MKRILGLTGFVVVCGCHFGCFPTAASILIKRSDSNFDKERHLVRADRLYRIGQIYSIDSLNTRLNKKSVSKVKIFLIDNSKIGSSEVQVINDFIYFRQQRLYKSVPSDTVKRMVIFGKVPGHAMLKQMFFYGGLCGLFLLASYDTSKPSLKSMGFAVLIGMPLGLLVGYGQREKETILINEYFIER